jgi:DNA-binding NarL/FixJ family response regulator
MTEPAPDPWPRRRLGELRSEFSKSVESSAAMSRVVVIDDHALLAESVAMTLRQAGLDARTIAFDAPNMVALVLELRPDLVLLDLFLTGTVDVSNAALVEFAKAGLNVVVVTATHDPLLHARCIELGASGVVEKSQPVDQLISAVLRGVRREPIMSVSKIAELGQILDASRRTVAPTSPFDALTTREKAVLHAILRGEAAGRIARDQQLSVLTIRAHIRSILSKLGVHSQLEAVSLATSEGWYARN